MMHVQSRQFLAGCALLAGLAFLTSACSSDKPASPAPAVAAQTPPAIAIPQPEFWGDLKPIVTVKELMRDMIDPIADNIFDSVSTVVIKGKTQEKVPKTDEDWDKVRVGAVTLVEGANLLKIARPFAPPDAPGPDATELSTAEITQKRAKD